MSQSPITPNEAKRLIKQALDERSLPYTKLTVKTVDFTDLARASRVFVKIHGWKPNPVADELDTIAKTHKFLIDWGGITSG